LVVAITSVAVVAPAASAMDVEPAAVNLVSAWPASAASHWKRFALVAGTPAGVETPTGALMTRKLIPVCADTSPAG